MAEHIALESMENQLRSSMRMAAFHLRQLLRTSFFLQTALIAPLSFVLLKWLGALGSGTPVSPLLWFEGSIAGLWATTTTAVGIVGFQRFQGTLEHLASSALPSARVFGSLTAAAALLGIVAIPISLAVQLFAIGQISLDWTMVLGLLLAVIACISSAGVLAALFVLTRRATAFEPLLLIPIWLLAGLVVPVSALPAWLQPFSWLLPLTGAVSLPRAEDPLHALLVGGASLVASALWLLLARVLLRSAITRARELGTLGLS